MKISSDGRIITMPLPIPIRNEVAEDLCSHPTRRAQSAPAHRHIDNAVKHAQKMRLLSWRADHASRIPAQEIDKYKAIANITDMTDHDVTADDAGS